MLILAVLTSLATPLCAQDYVVLDQRADEFDRWQDRVDWSYGKPVVSREFGVSASVVEEQRSRTQLGYGGLMIANALARETGRSFDEIVAMKQSGMGWGTIAQENGVQLGSIVSRLDRADSEFRKIKAKRGRAESKKPKKKHRGHRHGRGKGKHR